MAVLDPKPTVLGDLADIVRILHNLQDVSTDTRVYVSEGSLSLRDSDDDLLGAIRITDEGDTYSFVPEVIR